MKRVISCCFGKKTKNDRNFVNKDESLEKKYQTVKRIISNPQNNQTRTPPRVQPKCQTQEELPVYSVIDGQLKYKGETKVIVLSP